MKVRPVNSTPRRRAKCLLNFLLRFGIVELIWLDSRQNCSGVELNEISAGRFAEAWHMNIQTDGNNICYDGQCQRIYENAFSR